MYTVVLSPSQELTLRNIRLVAITTDVIQPDLASPCPKVRKRKSLKGPIIAQLPADNFSITNVPGIITYSAPCVIVEDFHPTLSSIHATNQSNLHILGDDGNICAYDPNILIVCTVVLANSNVRTFKQGALSADTSDIIQPNWSLTRAIERIGLHSKSVSIFQFTTNNPSFLNAKVIITHSAPCSIVEHFNTTLHVAGSTHETNNPWFT